jgi:hypothetical protein
LLIAERSDRAVEAVDGDLPCMERGSAERLFRCHCGSASSKKICVLLFDGCRTMHDAEFCSVTASMGISVPRRIFALT